MRRSIFEILENSYDISKEIKRIHTVFMLEKTLSYMYSDKYTIFEYVDEFCFTEWKNRGHCLSAKEFLQDVGYKEKQKNAACNLNDYLSFIEIVYNFWKMAENALVADSSKLKYYGNGNFYTILDIMTDELSRYNHKAIYAEDDEQILIIEDKPEVTAAAEVADEDIVMDILRYNHFSMRGDLKAKKAILLAMGANLEPKQGEIEKINRQLKSDIFYMLNNINIRHNNSTPGDKNYKQAVAEMDDETLETWYDELYQMMLLAILEMDQVERSEKVKELKTQVNG